MKLPRAQELAKHMRDKPYIYPGHIVFYRVGSDYMRCQMVNWPSVPPRYKVKVHGPYTPDQIIKGEIK
jgi:hypothetical protein